MAPIPLMVLLAKEIGLPIAKKVFSSLGSGKDHAGRLDKATALINSGATAVSAFQNAFGADFEKALTASIGNGLNGWSYEAGREEYVRVLQNEDSPRHVTNLLRDELNINLERINRVYGNKNPDLKNYFIGLFRQWQDRYLDLIGSDEDAKKTFETIDSLLDGRKKTVAGAVRMLQKTGLKSVGALLVIKAALIATSTGVGVIAAMTTWTLGIPVAQVGGLFVGGALLFGVSRMDFTPSNAMSATIATAYKLLDRQAAASNKT